MRAIKVCREEGGRKTLFDCQMDFTEADLKGLEKKKRDRLWRRNNEQRS